MRNPVATTRRAWAPHLSHRAGFLTAVVLVALAVTAGVAYGASQLLSTATKEPRVSTAPVSSAPVAAEEVSQVQPTTVPTTMAAIVEPTSTPAIPLVHTEWTVWRPVEDGPIPLPGDTPLYDGKSITWRKGAGHSPDDPRLTVWTPLLGDDIGGDYAGENGQFHFGDAAAFQDGSTWLVYVQAVENSDPRKATPGPVNVQDRLFLSQDNQKSWVELSLDITDRNWVTDVRIQGNTLYVGDLDGAWWKTQMP